MTLIADVFLEIAAPKNKVIKMSEQALFQRTLRETTLQKGRNTYCNLNGSTFTIFINHCEGSCIGKSLF